MGPAGCSTVISPVWGLADEISPLQTVVIEPGAAISGQVADPQARRIAANIKLPNAIGANGAAHLYFDQGQCR